MARNISNESLDDIENKSDVLNQTSYSLQDRSALGNDMFELNDMELLDTSVTDLLDDPYRMKLRRNSNYDGFDQSLGDSWIYPANYPMRQYQFTITEAALFKNTLVVLPTGLGKTFIAAVVMYNIYRWYPTGKVIFMAPTRPLVSQQIEACYRIMGIPRSDTAEVTGKQPRNKRTSLWQMKRVFYATPQVVLADLEAAEQMFPVQQVRLIVIDEAHKAKGRYAYVDVIRRIAKRNPYFRVLALSATPGRTLEDVAEVIRNLLISHVEVRWENSIDVLPYVFRKDVRTIVIPLGQTIARVRKDLLQLVNPYLQRLFESNVFMHYPGTITSGMLIMRHKQFRENALHQRHPNHSSIIADFGVCISMYHALDLLVKHGIRTFLNFFDDGAGTNVQEKYFVTKDRQIKTFLEQLREQFHHRKQQPISNDSSIITGDDDIDFGHPKYRILEKQLMTFFKEFPDSKAIVFCEFRDSVSMIKRMLSNNQPLIRPNCIVGQGGANGVRVAQQEQIDVMRHFRAGTYNTLIATCVAEEGIDVGEVDLIVCFDIAKNPMRFVQRIGRTGRQRVGRVLMLVTEGEEHDTLKQVLASKDKTNQQLARSKDILRILYPHSPRLVPAGLQPECVKMYMNIPDEQTKVRDACVDSSDEDVHNTSKENGRKRKYTRRKNDANETAEPSPKRNKTITKTRDVRDFFPLQRIDPTDALDASDRDIFAVESPNPRHRNSLKGRLDIGNTSIPIDQTIRHGRTDAQVAIDALLQPLLRHYKQLCRQKFLYGQKLLNASGQTKMGEQETPISIPVLDDPLDLPELVPHAMGDADTSQAAEEKSCAAENSIMNLFDSSFCALESTSTGTCLWEDTSKPSKESANVSERKTRLSTLKKTKKQNTSPKDICNSPLLLAFNRSVQKRNAPKHSTPACTSRSNTHSTAAPSKPINESSSSVSHTMVLEYFRLKSMEDIFESDSSDELVPESFIAVNEQKQADEKATVKEPSVSRNLFGELKTVQTTNIPEELVNLETTSVNQHKIITDPMLESSHKQSRKNFDLGTADLVFEDDSISQQQSSNNRSKSNCCRPINFSALRLKNPKNDFRNINTDEMYCLPGKLPYFVGSYAKRSPVPSVENGKQPCEISEAVDSRNNNSQIEQVDMDESIIIGPQNRRVIKHRINSSTESLMDESNEGESQSIFCRLNGTSVSVAEKDEDVFHSAVELRSSNASKRRNKQRKTKRAGREFLQTQAAVSDDDDEYGDNVDDEDANMTTLSGFVTASDDEISTVDMRAIYLQSVRSPVVRRGGFKMPSGGARQASILNGTDAHCMEEEEMDTSEEYSQMSFINDNTIMSSKSELSDLEIAERLINKDRRSKKQSDRSSTKNKKRRRRIVSLSSDTD